MSTSKTKDRRFKIVGLLMVRVFLQHFFEKPSNINGLRAITKQYLHLKTEYNSKT